MKNSDQDFLELSERVTSAREEYARLRRSRDDAKALVDAKRREYRAAAHPLRLEHEEAEALCAAKWREYRELQDALKQVGRARLGRL